MPVKNRIKTYLPQSYYHIYNRGVEKRKIFQDQQDYSVIFSYLKEYLEPKKEKNIIKLATTKKYREKDKILRKIDIKNYADTIQLIGFCFMPNHFHLLIYQQGGRDIEQFIKSLFTRYVGYFNKKYHRVGGLFESAYKAVLVHSDEQLIHLSRYIHQNPISLNDYHVNNLKDYPYSSLNAYLGKQKLMWLKAKVVLNHFSNTNKVLSYDYFVKQIIGEDSKKIKLISLD